MSISNNKLFTLKEMATRLNIDEQILRNAIKDKKLTAVELGRGYQVTESWIDAWLTPKVVNPEAAEFSRAGGE